MVIDSFDISFRAGMDVSGLIESIEGVKCVLYMNKN